MSRPFGAGHGISYRHSGDQVFRAPALFDHIHDDRSVRVPPIICPQEIESSSTTMGPAVAFDPYLCWDSQLNCFSNGGREL